MENKYYEMNIAGCIRRLPRIRITDSMEIASFVLLGDAELVVKAAAELVKKVPEVDYLITAEAKGIPLIQEMARILDMKRYFVARKSVKPYMIDPFVTEVYSITTQKKQILCLDREESNMIRGKKILIVDDDENIAELISLYLTKECYETKIVGDGEEALKVFPVFKPNLILLDLMLPGMDGYQVCRELRSSSQVPIIMLSAKGEIFDKVLGLELGADDYMIKPFDSKELVARVKAVLRRYQAAPQPQEPAGPDQKGQYVEFPDLIVNLTNYSVIYNGHSIEMPPKELELLYFLASSPNQVFTREQLLDHIWGYEYIGDTRTVDVHIKRLREKIKDHEKWALTTVWGIGYKFEVKR